MPLWRVYPGTWNVSSARARSARLNCRPIRDTVAATWKWLIADGTTISHHRQAAIGLDEARERELIIAWEEDSRKSVG